MENHVSSSGVLPAERGGARTALGKCWVVGASGVVGEALLAAGREGAVEMEGTSTRGGLLRPFDALRDSILDLVPDLGPGDCVFWLAARTDPAWIAKNPAETRALNVEATLRGFQAVQAAGAKVVFLSTELVFDGVLGGYPEEAAPHPSTEYGKQKVEVERWLMASPGAWCLVRTGALVAWRRGTNCPVAKTYRSLMGPGARMARDNRFSLTDARDLARHLLRLAGAERQGIYHLAASPPVGRTQLADWIREDSRWRDRMGYVPVAFEEIPYSEPRPRLSWLGCGRAEREWGAAFAPPRDTVRVKVSLLDQWYEEGGLP